MHINLHYGNIQRSLLNIHFVSLPDCMESTCGNKPKCMGYITISNIHNPLPPQHRHLGYNFVWNHWRYHTACGLVVCGSNGVGCLDGVPQNKENEQTNATLKGYAKLLHSHMCIWHRFREKARNKCYKNFTYKQNTVTIMHVIINAERTCACATILFNSCATLFSGNSRVWASVFLSPRLLLIIVN